MILLGGTRDALHRINHVGKLGSLNFNYSLSIQMMNVRSQNYGIRT